VLGYGIVSKSTTSSGSYLISYLKFTLLNIPLLLGTRLEG